MYNRKRYIYMIIYNDEKKKYRKRFYLVLFNVQNKLILVKKSLLDLPLLKEIKAASLLKLTLTGNLMLLVG